MDMRVGRHERRIERALGEDRAEVIGQAQRHEEGIRRRSGAHDRRKHDVARKSADARQKRIAADGEDTTEHAPLLTELAGGLKDIPSPRLRGEGQGEGESPQIEFRRVPLTRRYAPTFPRKRGEVNTGANHALKNPRTAAMMRS